MWKVLKHGLWTVLSMYASCDTIVSINVAHKHIIYECCSYIKCYHVLIIYQALGTYGHRVLITGIHVLATCSKNEGVLNNENMIAF